jgi:hypothetical protein
VSDSPIRADNVEPEKVDYLWGDRIPKGMITIVAGRPDQGKGLFAARVAADCSTATGLAEHLDEPVNVLYSAAEDSHGLMTRPRLEAAGADLERILLWRFAVPANFAEFADIVVEQNIGLVVIDPFASHLSHGISRHADNVRNVLGPVRDVIETTGASLLIIEHALKRAPANGHPLAAIGGGGSGLPAFARAAYLFGRDPDDVDARVLAPVKFNIGKWPDAVHFEVQVEPFDKVGEIPYLEMDDEIPDFDAIDLVSNKKNAPGTTGRPPDKRAAAAEWITNYLAEAEGPVLSSQVLADAKQYKLSEKTVRRAAADMGIVKGGGGPKTTWDLPKDVKDLLGIDTDDGDATGDTTVDPNLIGPTLEDGRFFTDDVAVDVESMNAALAEILGGSQDAPDGE